MKKSSILRTLTALSFLLFLLPFLRMCSVERIKSFTGQTYNEEIWVEQFIVEHEREPTKKEHQQLMKKLNKEWAEAIQESKQEMSNNFYTMTWTAVTAEITTAKKDKEFYAFYCFALISISSVIMFCLSFFNKFKWIFTLGITNVVLLALAVVILIATDFLTSIDQLLIGFYLVLLNTLLIVWFARKLHRGQ